MGVMYLDATNMPIHAINLYSNINGRIGQRTKWKREMRYFNLILYTKVQSVGCCNIQIANVAFYVGINSYMTYPKQQQLHVYR